jgi:hypothetical protein
MVIETPQRYDDACTELWELCAVENETPEQLARMVELAEAIEDYEKAKYGFEGEE